MDDWTVVAAVVGGVVAVMVLAAAVAWWWIGAGEQVDRAVAQALDVEVDGVGADELDETAARARELIGIGPAQRYVGPGLEGARWRI
jgi:phage-related minor tail protein